MAFARSLILKFIDYEKGVKKNGLLFICTFKIENILTTLNGNNGQAHLCGDLRLFCIFFSTYFM